ncbi:flavin reductase family protein [Streptomyces sp. UNOC14_S4]|uniref:flavin reductase family protein n=1 Tax=Streptomyces sp. UNOC14_S4 TaxID=2872340 RepID=UPI001E397FF9|nr:flavin reductase family protein [Streptomyces sp. UNOC14_S4]MCC3768204.1 flavin reductase family protein [Streptomyces sp. UNOC14_S4]
MSVDAGLELTEFRTVLGRFASGVVVVTTRDATGAPQGFTASSFCSVSLDPPLVLVCLAETANSYAAFSAADGCAISILAEDQGDVARRFATKGGDKFAEGAFVPLANGSLGVEEALGVLECGIRQRHRAGDHVILVAEVTSLRAAAGDPMIYFGGGFHGLGPGGG